MKRLFIFFFILIGLAAYPITAHTAVYYVTVEDQHGNELEVENLRGTTAYGNIRDSDYKTNLGGRYGDNYIEIPFEHIKEINIRPLETGYYLQTIFLKDGSTKKLKTYKRSSFKGTSQFGAGLYFRVGDAVSIKFHSEPHHIDFSTIKVKRKIFDCILYDNHGNTMPISDFRGTTAYGNIRDSDYKTNLGGRYGSFYLAIPYERISTVEIKKAEENSFSQTVTLLDGSKIETFVYKRASFKGKTEFGKAAFFNPSSISKLRFLHVGRGKHCPLDNYLFFNIQLTKCPFCGEPLEINHSALAEDIAKIALRNGRLFTRSIPILEKSREANKKAPVPTALSDQAIELLINTATPDADEKTRCLQRAAIKYLFSIDEKKARKHLDEIHKIAESIVN